MLKVPEGHDAKAYRTGDWIKKADLTELVTVVRKCNLTLMTFIYIKFYGLHFLYIDSSKNKA